MSTGIWKKARQRLTTLSRYAILIPAMAVAASSACQYSNKPRENQKETAVQSSEQREPTIEAAPITKGDDQWQLLDSDTVTLTVTALGAQSVKILCRPAFSESRHLELKKLSSPSDASTGTFSTQLKVPADFAGDVWAEVSYAQGGKKKTKPIALTTENVPAFVLADSTYKHSDESARSDTITGGTIEKTTLLPGQPAIRITVNVPAFQLTLWQNGKEVKTYQIGIGRREYPLPAGLRRATQIVFNPEWVPPDSSWVDEHDVTPGERVEADDPRNPLGKIKIPLGNGILIHQASRPSDLGQLVSHGCVRLLTTDLFDLSEKIIAARRLPVSKQQIDHAKASKDRLFVKLDTPLIVDISYDTQVVEGGALHLYPDVYDHKTNTIENLRQELQGVGIDPSSLDDNTLRQMLSRVTMSQEFVVSIADIKAANALIAGRNQPLTAQPVKKQPMKTRQGSAKLRR